MYLVANSLFLRNLRTLDYFTLDLGKTRRLVSGKDKQFRKLSEFEIKYANLYQRRLMMFGNIGKMDFYEDLSLKENVFLVFKDDDIYEIEWTQDDLKDFSNYILDTLRKIAEINYNNEEQQGTIDKYIDNDNDGWIATDDKNRNKKYVINQELDKDAYRNALIKSKEGKR